MGGLRVAEIAPTAMELDETARAPSEGLVRSMEQYGLLQPVDVEARADGRLRLLDGSRRVRAARELGWDAITAIVAPAGDGAGPVDLRAIEIDAHRERLRHLHLARRCRRLLQETGWSQAELARRIGRSKQSNSELLAVLACPDLVQAFDVEGMEFGAVRALLPLGPGQRRALLAELQAHREREGKPLPVRAVEERVRRLRGGAALPSVRLADLEAVAWAFEGRGLPVEMKVVRRKQAGLKIEMALGEEEVPWLEAVLAGQAVETRRAA